MRVVVLLLWLLGVADALAEGPALQALHEIRTRGYLLCSSALLYYDPANKTPDPRALASSYGSLVLLQTRTVQLGQPPQLVDIQRGLQAVMTALEQMPRRDAEHYPERLARLLQVQRQGESWAAEQYRKLGGAAPQTVRELHRQSLDMARLLLDFQARAYPLVDGAYSRMDSARRATLDRRIGQRFERLVLPGELAGSLGDVRNNYRFVRARLLDDRGRRPSGGIEFYLARSIIDLDELAERTLALAQGQPQARVGLAEREAPALAAAQ